MSDFTETLNINREDALNVAQAYEGYARALSDKDKDKDLPFIASSWLISAIYQSLLDPQKAKRLFALSANSFLQLQSPLWRLCGICGQWTIKNSFNKSKDEEDYLDEEDAFYRILQQYDTGRDQGVAYYANQYEALNSPLTGRVPHLNIPYQVVIEALDEVNNIRFTRSKPVKRFSNLLTRLAELTSLYQTDEYRWRNVQGQILPFEPAALAICVVLVKKWCIDHSYQELVNKLKDLNTPPMPMLQIAYELVFNDVQS